MPEEKREACNLYSRWSLEDIRKLKELYYDTKDSEIAKILGRTVSSVRHKANDDLGLRKSSPFIAKIGVKPPTEIDWDIETRKIMAWVIAAEGSIGIHKTRRGRSRRIVIYPKMAVFNSDRRFVDEFRNLVSVGKPSRITRKHHLNHKNWKPVYEWRIFGLKQTMQICEAILPHLPIKREQAELLIRFCRRRLSRLEAHDDVSYDEEDISMYEEMKALNQRGLNENA